MKNAIRSLESFVLSKTGLEKDSEDVIHLSEHFAAVIDGSTAKTAQTWQGLTPGRKCAETVSATLDSLPARASLAEALEAFTAAVQRIYEEEGMVRQAESDPSLRATAMAVIYSKARREVWLIGDCQFMIDDRTVTNPKRVDAVMSEARSLYLRAALLQGSSIEDLKRNDVGRTYILPLLQRQQLFQNNPAAGEFCYPAIDGFPIPADRVINEKIPTWARTLILASDGYPAVMGSLAESETKLEQSLAADPLRMLDFKSTKGLVNGNRYCDDRAYLKLRL